MNNVMQREKAKMVLWFLVCFSLMLGSCTGNTVEEAITESVSNESFVTLPEEIVRISDFGLGNANISGTVKEETLDWMGQSMNRYAAMLVDAVPFLTTQADLSDLKIYKTSPLDDDGSYSIDLPQQLSGEGGMQVMMLAIENTDCLISGNQLFYCWDAELSSIAFEDASQSKVMDGQVLVWAADDERSFPESIGADGLFFTDDDELVTLEPGYTLIDLGAKPFTFSHQGDREMALYSNYDPSVRDLSELTYIEAFERIFDDMREGYAFNGVEGKEPDWDAVYELIYPQVQAAEESGDVNEWVSALNAYTQQFSDSHVSISGKVVDDWVEELYSHGLVYYYTPMTNGDIIYTHGTMHEVERERFTIGREGDTLVGINKEPVEEELQSFQPLFGSYSNPEMYYRSKIRDITHIYYEEPTKFQLDLLRGWTNSEERVKWGRAYSISADDFHPVFYSENVPVSFERLYSGIGVITIHSDGFQTKETIKLFEEALKQFTAANVDTIIIDMRDSDEYRFMNYAGYLSDTIMELGEMQWHQLGDPSGKEREQSFVSVPAVDSFSFERIAILTGEYCKNACEADVYALSLLPQSTVFASTPTFGSFSIMDGNPITLPGDVLFNYPTGIIKDINNELLIEGQGVQQDVVLEEKISNYLLDYDWRLFLVDDLITYSEEIDIIPQSNPVFLLLNDDELDDIIDDIEQRDIEYLAREVYPELFRSIDYAYRVFVEDPGKLIVSEKWCTTVPDLTLYKGEEMNIEFIVDGQSIDEKYLNIRIIDKGLYKCWVKFAVLDHWEPGSHHVKINTNIFGRLVFDGEKHYDEGDYSEEYTVIVKESE